MFSTVLSWFALGISVISCVLALMALGIARFRVGHKASTAHFAKLEAELTDLTSSIEGVRLAMTKIRARLNAQTRKTTNGAAAEPEHDLNSEAGRTAARRELEASLAQAGRLHSRGHR